MAAVSPIIEIGECVKALERPGNRLYQWNFVKDLKRRMRRKDRFWPGRFDLSLLDRIRTVREFDDAYTAPHFGFGGAERLLLPRQRDADHRAHSRSRAGDHGRRRSVRAAGSRFATRSCPAIPCIELDVCAHGGHCGFVGPASGEDDGYWAENRIVEFGATRRGDSIGGRLTSSRSACA